MKQGKGAAGNRCCNGELEADDAGSIVEQRFAVQPSRNIAVEVGGFRKGGHRYGVGGAQGEAQREGGGEGDGGQQGVDAEAHGDGDCHDQADGEREDDRAVLPKTEFIRGFRLVEQKRCDE